MYHKFPFWKQQSWYKSDNCQFIVLIRMEHFHMFRHFYAALFSLIKRVFIKIATFFISSTRLIFAKLSSASETSRKKKKIRSHMTLFKILQLLFADKDFWMEMRLFNIFKTSNAITLAKTVLEKPYKVLQGSWKGVLNKKIFKRLVQFSKAVQF